jgi:hypothetical protein
MCKLPENRLDRYAEQARNREYEAWSADVDRKNREQVLLTATAWPGPAGLPFARSCAMRMRFLLVMLTGLLLGANPPPKLQDFYYARVQLQGGWEGATQPDLPGILQAKLDLNQPGLTRFPVDVSKLKGWTYDEIRRATGKYVRITGTLEMRRVKTSDVTSEERVVIIAKTFEVVDPFKEKP